MDISSHLMVALLPLSLLAGLLQFRQPPAEGFGRPQPAQAALPNGKQPLLLKPANASDLRNPNQQSQQKPKTGNVAKPSANVLLTEAELRNSIAKVREPSADASTTSKATKGSGIPVISSDVDSRKDVGTGYGFRGWSYARTRVALSLDSEAEFACLDTGSGIVLIDRNFFKAQSDAPIRKMASPISVRGLGTAKHMSDEYAIASLYFPGKDKNGDAVMAKITREVHLVDDLKANMLVGNDLLGPERVTIDVAKKSAYIGSCDTTIEVEVKTARTVVHERIHARKAVDVPLRSKMAVPVHHTAIPSDRDFFFEPDDTNLSLYAHIINAETTSILVENESDKTVHIPRNYRLGRVLELDFPNAFQVQDEGDDVAELALRKASANHKQGWFKKVLAAAYAATALLPATSLSTGNAALTGLEMPSAAVIPTMPAPFPYRSNLPPI